MPEHETRSEAFADVLSRPPLGAAGCVLDYVGDRARRLSSKNDLNVATWLVQHPDRLDEVCRQLREDPNQDRRRLLERHAPIMNEKGVSADDLLDLVSWGDFVQIRNDLSGTLKDGDDVTETEQFMLSEGRIDNQSEILDVGCSCGKHLRKVLPLNPRRIVGADFNLFALALGAEAWKQKGNEDRALWVCADALALPFKDASFTHVNSFGTLVLLPIAATLAEYWRVLSPGGRLTITVEGMGLWRRFWDQGKSYPVRRLHLLRGLAGDWLLRLGLDWQRNKILRRLSRHVQFQPDTISRLVGGSGFEVDRCTVLREYNGLPWIIGLSARKRHA